MASKIKDSPSFRVPVHSRAIFIFWRMHNKVAHKSETPHRKIFSGQDRHFRFHTR